MRFIILFFFVTIFLEAKTPYKLGKELYLAKGYLSDRLKRFRAKKSDTQQQKMIISYAVNLNNEDSAESYDTSFALHGDRRS